MFWSEELLSKTGPLARVWLASNVDRKLSKQQILSQDLTNSVTVIVQQGNGPVALRTSAQLMLGVVKIYGRKAKYLLDDCNDTLVKIRMTFRTTSNHDLAHQTTTAIDLNLPEQLTIDDLFPALDFGFPLTQQPQAQIEDRTIDYEDDWTSSLDPQTQADSGTGIGAAALHDDDLGLDLGEDIGLDETTISVQVGRGGATPHPNDPSILPAYDEGDDLGLDLGEDVGFADTTARIQDEPMVGLDDDEAPIDVDEEAALRDTTAERQDSPLSEADPEFMADADRTFTQLQDEIEEEQVVAQQRQTSRKLKPMVADRETVLHNSEIKAWGNDTSRLLKPQSLLPQDPELLALLEMQRSGNFVTNAMNDGLGSGWAPEIQGLLSFDIVLRSGQKRKRDSGIADIASEDEHSDKSPRLDRSQVDENAMLDDEGVEIRDPSQSPARIQSELPEEHQPIDENDPTLADVVLGEDDEGIYPGDGGFDETTMPLVHPADSGPISVGTQHAVHLLREVFGSSPAADSPASQSRKSVLLQDLIPEGRTSREDATKMFFETLVLATKDAIKVDQKSDQLGLPIRVRAKRGLWGQWAESTQENVAQEIAASA